MHRWSQTINGEVALKLQRNNNWSYSLHSLHLLVLYHVRLLTQSSGHRQTLDSFGSSLCIPSATFSFFFCCSIDDPKHFLTNILRKYRNGKPLFLYFEDQALEFWVKTKECSSKPAYLRCMIILWLSQTEGNCISWVFVNCIFRTAHHGMVQTDSNNQLQQITGTTKYK